MPQATATKPNFQIIGIHLDGARGDQNNVTSIARALAEQFQLDFSQYCNIFGTDSEQNSFEHLTKLLNGISIDTRLVFILAGIGKDSFIIKLANRIKTIEQLRPRTTPLHKPHKSLTLRGNLFRPGLLKTILNQLFAIFCATKPSRTVTVVYTTHHLPEGINPPNENGPDLIVCPSLPSKETPKHHLPVRVVPNDLGDSELERHKEWQEPPITIKGLDLKIKINGPLPEIKDNSVLLILPGDTTQQNTRTHFTNDDAVELANKAIEKLDNNKKFEFIVINGPRTGQHLEQKTHPPLDDISKNFIKQLATSDKVTQITIFPFDENKSVYKPLLYALKNSQAKIQAWVAGDSASMLGEIFEVLGGKHSVNLMVSPTMQEEHRKAVKPIFNGGDLKTNASSFLIQMPNQGANEPRTAEVVAQKIGELLQQQQN